MTSSRNGPVRSGCLHCTWQSMRVKKLQLCRWHHRCPSPRKMKLRLHNPMHMSHLCMSMCADMPMQMHMQFAKGDSLLTAALFASLYMYVLKCSRCYVCICLSWIYWTGSELRQETRNVFRRKNALDGCVKDCATSMVDHLRTKKLAERLHSNAPEKNRLR